MADFTRRKDESAAQWLARLKSVGLSALSKEERGALLGAEQAARGQVGQERRAAEAPLQSEPTLLDAAREAYHRLTPEDRQQFILWLAQGAPRDA
jgi:hypothetical protein